ncbi:MAG: ATP-binding cassette domain-containing protein [Candidatus Micrarchaeota archaeon]
MSAATLSIKNIYAGYDKLEILHDISFSFNQTDFVTLVGANGAGKSTLLKVISGVIVPTDGVVELNGKNLLSLSVKERLENGIAYVPQGKKIFPGLSVKENLELVSSDFSHVLDIFPSIKTKLNIRSEFLSGGEQQMVGLARALLFKPKFLLLDEPSIGLSPSLVDKTFKIFKKLNEEEGTGILVVEQNVKKALEYVHYGYILELGKIKQKVTKDDLENPDFKRVYLGI